MSEIERWAAAMSADQSPSQGSSQPNPLAGKLYRFQTVPARDVRVGDLIAPNFGYDERGVITGFSLVTAREDVPGGFVMIEDDGDDREVYRPDTECAVLREVEGA